MPFSKWFSQKINQTYVTAPDQLNQEQADQKINGNLEDTISYINRIFGENADFSMRRFHVFGQYSAVMFYYSNMIDQNNLNTDILKPLMLTSPKRKGRELNPDRLKDVLINETLYHSEAVLENRLSKLVEGILRGQTIVAVEGLDDAFLIGTRNIEKRSIDQPATEQVIRGPREGFIELLGTNIALLRYRLQTPDLCVRTLEIGSRTKSKVAVCFMQGIANPELIEEVMQRLSIIDIDAVLDSGYLEQFIEDNHISPFPQVQYTERPDKVAANLLEGRVAILVDGSPLALLVPTVFNQFYQAVEDYTERFLLMSAIRLARLVALMFSLVFPSLYVGVISFNPELIPTEFAVAVAGGRAGVPFPAVIEVLVIEISMEVLREATIRLPQQVGGALSIVGVLVIGQAAVAAGFASPITVVIIALTTIGSFATPAYNAALALRLLRFPLIVMAGIFGLYGVVVGLILIVNHLLSLKSFGVPYLSPLVPGSFQGMKDLFTRGPLWSLRKRPVFLKPLDQTKLDESIVEKLKVPSDHLNTSSRSQVGKGDITGEGSSKDNGDPGGDYIS
ncbi:spore germination protein [Brevibacillus choshinensis]|uniref:Spore germination protein n=1 Tax=Brevibacillus choshinensis TaxID=54911 RepID=A0ABX7FJG0_BRECH|nr:spore germination protein [Brevibacillus choshinensis]QRG65874.1 spore germination protein [Brevibacillus choshinensis]